MVLLEFRLDKPMLYMLGKVLFEILRAIPFHRVGELSNLRSNSINLIVVYNCSVYCAQCTILSNHPAILLMIFSKMEWWIWLNLFLNGSWYITLIGNRKKHRLAVILYLISAFSGKSSQHKSPQTGPFNFDLTSNLIPT